MPEEKDDDEKGKSSLAEIFTEHINHLIKKISINSKVNEFIIGNKECKEVQIKIIVFQVENINYITIQDSGDLIAYHLDRGGYKVFEGYDEWLYKRLRQYKMSEIDQEFECEEDINVTKLEFLTRNLFEKILVKSVKIKDNVCNSKQIDFYIDCINEADVMKHKQNTKRLNNMDELILSKIKTSDDIEMEATRNVECVNEKIFPIDDACSLSTKDDKKNEFQHFSRDWTNEMVDSIICNMYVNKDPKKVKPLNEVNYQIHPPQFEHEFLEMQSQMVKNDRINTTRPFVCHFRNCNRAFKRFEHLKRHYRIHTGERPFKCKFPGCHKAFARSDNLNQHLRVHNSGPQINNSTRNIRYFDKNK